MPHLPQRSLRVATAVGAAALGLALAAPASADGSFGPLPPQNPHTAPNGTATMHGDTASSDTTPYGSPGTGRIDAVRRGLAAACPAITVGADGMPVALCTEVLGRTPVVHLLNPDTGRSLASLRVEKGALFGGVYAFLDDADRLVLVDGDHNLLRISHRRTWLGWRLEVASSTSLDAAIPDGASVVGLSPGWDGEVWFAASDGTVGTVDPDGTVRTTALGEPVQNSISTVPGLTGVVTEHALYGVKRGADGAPAVAWRQPYDRGPSRKPGQLSWGSGATPTFFGPVDGTEYVAITDNAAPHENLIVRRSADGAAVCRLPVLTDHAASGTEDSMIASGRSMIVTNTYGYPYPASPEGVPDPVPATADFDGGMTRVDVRADGSGCDVVWENDVASAALPRLSLADDLITTITVDGPTGLVGSHTIAAYSYATLDPHTGAELSASFLGLGLAYNPLQMTGTTAANGTLYQGTETGIVRISRD
ncbi:hypothetical protein CLV56_1525 [Mumia flava]|uniref:Uncharacterized protein n=1 Tax=Mumia flava TaxID=1348852 RepID=A0A0B2BT07_9ACTN|nr:hypothetical protein [Mumia flava]PJJ57298.1 hypothetical protein CLV56_1525 [Mumia flava]